MVRTQTPGDSGVSPKLDGQDATLFISSRRSDGASRIGPLPRLKGNARLPVRAKRPARHSARKGGRDTDDDTTNTTGRRLLLCRHAPQGGQI